MGIGMGQLTFITDGTDYVCIWSPPDASYPSKNDRPLGLISAMLIADAADFKRWQEDMNNRWLDACARILGANREDILVEQVSGSKTN